MTELTINTGSKLTKFGTSVDSFIIIIYYHTFKNAIISMCKLQKKYIIRQKKRRNPDNSSTVVNR